MHKTITTFIVLMLAFTYATPSFAQGYDDLLWWQHECNQMVIERIEEKNAYKKGRLEKSMMDQSGNFMNECKTIQIAEDALREMSASPVQKSGIAYLKGYRKGIEKAAARAVAQSLQMGIPATISTGLGVSLKRRKR